LLAGLDLGTGGRAEVKVRGHLAVVNENDGLFVIDLGNPSLPAIAAHLGAESFSDAALGDGVAVAVPTPGGLPVVFNLSDPSNPVQAAQLPLFFQSGVALDGRIAYVLSRPEFDADQNAYFDSLRAYDLTDPASPVLLDELTALPAHVLPNGAFASSPLTIAGDRLYAVSGDKIRVVDISDPTNLTLLATMSTAPSSREMVVVGNVGYVAADQFLVLDLNGLPADPPVLGSVDRILFNVARHASGIVYGAEGTSAINGDVPIIDASACPMPPMITDPPRSASAVAGGAPVVFEVAAAFADAYQWRFNGVPISDGPNYTGTTTPALTVRPLAATEGTYDVLVTNPQGSVSAGPAVLAVTENADLNGDGVVDLLDYALFSAQFGGPFP
ncbi:MAG: hypothetical protein D6788_07155, partial [Planctomycetota bacterium]